MTLYLNLYPQNSLGFIECRGGTEMQICRSSREVFCPDYFDKIKSNGMVLTLGCPNIDYFGEIALQNCHGQGEIGIRVIHWKDSGQRRFAFFQCIYPEVKDFIKSIVLVSVVKRVSLQGGLSNKGTNYFYSSGVVEPSSIFLSKRISLVLTIRNLIRAKYCRDGSNGLNPSSPVRFAQLLVKASNNQRGNYGQRQHQVTHKAVF